MIFNGDYKILSLKRRIYSSHGGFFNLFLRLSNANSALGNCTLPRNLLSQHAIEDKYLHMLVKEGKRKREFTSIYRQQLVILSLFLLWLKCGTDFWLITPMNSTFLCGGIIENSLLPFLFAFHRLLIPTKTPHNLTLCEFSHSVLFIAKSA